MSAAMQPCGRDSGGHRFRISLEIGDDRVYEPYALTLSGAGLPQLPALTGAAKSYAERLFRFPTIDRLDAQAGRDALELPARAEGVDLQREATGRIAELTEGYPYLLQEYGKHVWNVAAGTTISPEDVERAHDLVQLELDESFFQVRIGRATKAELAYLVAMAHLGAGPYRSGEIASKLGRAGPESVAPTRARLIEKRPHLQSFLRPQRVHRPPSRVRARRPSRPMDRPFTSEETSNE
jgi:hypothetical protein